MSRPTSARIHAIGHGLTYVAPAPSVLGLALWIITGSSWWVALGIAAGVLVLATSAALMPLYSRLQEREASRRRRQA